MTTFYTLQYPTVSGPSIFLAGPTPRSNDIQSWRPEAVRLLESLGFTGNIYCPEMMPGTPYPKDRYEDILTWEEKCLEDADVILFWVPRSEKMPAFTTNIEFGAYRDSGKIVFGAPEDANSMEYLLSWCRRLGVETSQTLEGVCLSSLTLLASKSGSVKSRPFGVPCELWSNTEFQNWYTSQVNLGCRVSVTKYRRTPLYGPIFSYTFLANVTAPNKHKYSEVVSYRTPTSHVIPYVPTGTDPMDYQVLLIKEYRATSAGWVLTSAGGSSETTSDPREVASSELFEEMGILKSPSEMVPLGVGIPASQPYSLYRQSVYAVELTESEAFGFEGTFHGEADQGECTVVVSDNIREILNQKNLDWCTRGHLMALLSRLRSRR